MGRGHSPARYHARPFHANPTQVYTPARPCPRELDRLLGVALRSSLEFDLLGLAIGDEVVQGSRRRAGRVWRQRMRGHHGLGKIFYKAPEGSIDVLPRLAQVELADVQRGEQVVRLPLGLPPEGGGGHVQRGRSLPSGLSPKK